MTIGLSDYVFPFPARAGKERHIDTVDQSLFEGWPFRPTAVEASSMQYLPGEYDAWPRYALPPALGGTFEAARDIESKSKAELVGATEQGTFRSINDILTTAAESASTFFSIADRMQTEWRLTPQSSEPGSNVPGRPPAPALVHQTGAPREQLIQEKFQAISDAIGATVRQVKGLFNISYPDTTEPPAGGFPPPGVTQTVEGRKSIMYALAVIAVFFVAFK